MQRKILTGTVVLLFMMAIIVPATSISEDYKDFIRYINGDTPKDLSKYTKVYDNVFGFGIGHNQKEIDKNYKIDGKWIIKGKEYDLAIAPYSGNTFIDTLLASNEHIGIPVVSGKAFAPYEGTLFRNVEGHSGFGLAFKNQVELGTINYEQATLYAYPKTFSEEVDPRDTYIINKGDPIKYLPWVKLEAREGKPEVRFGWTIRFGAGESHIKEGPGKGHDLEEYLKKEEPGGVDFTSIRLNYISASNNSFNYVIKAKKLEEGDGIMEIEDGAGNSLISFLTGLSIPENKFWVNLNPWEPDRIIEKDLEATDAGRIMLEADLQMKKDFCKYKDPCTREIGETYWDLLDDKREKLINEIMNKHPNEIKDINNVLFQITTRHWIVPSRVNVYEGGNEIYIVNSTLNIYSEPVYEDSTYEFVDQNALFVSRACKDDLSEAVKAYGRYAKELEEEMILPLVVHGVNQGKNYSDLRCLYNSLALAQWYKDKYRYSPSIFTDFIDSTDLTGLESKSEWNAENIWSDYVKSFAEGEFHCWKNETYQEGDYVITRTKHYSSGGVDFGDIETSIVGDMPSDLRDLTSKAIYSIFAKEGNDYYFGDGLYVFYEGLEKATFEIRKLIISPAMVKIGKPVTIKVVVKNAGDTEDTKTINIEIDDRIVGSKEVTLAPDEIITLEFTQIQSAEGDHSITVEGLTGNYKVVTPGFEVIFAIIGLLSVVYLINLKKKKKRK